MRKSTSIKFCEVKGEIQKPKSGFAGSVYVIYKDEKKALTS